MNYDDPLRQDPLPLADTRKLRTFTRLLREPVVVSGAAYRSGAHPVLATQIAVEVSRSPKTGLVEKLMAEGREAFVTHDYPTAIIKLLAVRELLDTYGGLLTRDQENQIRDQIAFLKIQFFILSGESGEAYRVLQGLRLRSHPYLWHRQMARRSGVTDEHWLVLEKNLYQFFSTGRSGKIFCLIGYTMVCGPYPERIKALSKELDFEPHNQERLFDAIYQDYSFITTRLTRRNREYLPHNLATEFKLTPLIKKDNSVYLGSSASLKEAEIRVIEQRIQNEAILVPITFRQLRDRNFWLYEC